MEHYIGGRARANTDIYDFPKTFESTFEFSTLSDKQYTRHRVKTVDERRKFRLWTATGHWILLSSKANKALVYSLSLFDHSTAAASSSGYRMMPQFTFVLRLWSKLIQLYTLVSSFLVITGSLYRKVCLLSLCFCHILSKGGGRGEGRLHLIIQRLQIQASPSPNLLCMCSV